METPQTLHPTLVDQSVRRVAGPSLYCAACAYHGWFDVQAMGYVAPSVIREFKIPGPQMDGIQPRALGVLLGSFPVQHVVR